MINMTDKMYYIQYVKGDAGRYILLSGNPLRTDLITSFFDDARLVAHNRERKTWTGYLGGVKVSVTSADMGYPSTTIALEELIKYGADTFICMGTTGRVYDATFALELDGVINTAVVQDERTIIHYIPIEYPVVADCHVVDALTRAAANSGYHYAGDITQSKDPFYGQHELDSIPATACLHERQEAWWKDNMMTSEMETAAIFVISFIRGYRTSSIMSFGDMEKTVRVVCDAIRLLIKED